MSLLTTIQTIKESGFTPEIRSRYSKDELYIIQKILEEVEETGKSATLDSLWDHDFETKPVPVAEFLEDDYYLGLVGRGVYPKWRKDLEVVLSPYSSVVEWVMRGSIGSGKTTVAVIAMLYKIYYLTCLKNPQKFFGLVEGSAIIFGLFNIFKYLVEATSYQTLLTYLRDMSPYFQSFRLVDSRGRAKRETDRQVMKLPKNIGIALGSQALDALGQNIIGGICDEADFGKQKSMSDTDKSQIADLYHNVRTRMDSRFMRRGGGNPGLLCLISSAKTEDSFLAKHEEERRDNPTSHISSYALYEVKEDVYKDSKRFTVVVGDKLNKSYILEDEGGESREGAREVKVPEEFLGAFRYDIDTALRDIAGVSTYGKLLLIPRRDLLLSNFTDSTPRKHPFSKETVELGIDDDVTLDNYFLPDEILDLYDKSNMFYRPKFFPHADRFVHVDLAKNKDCAGIAMSCISETKNIVRYNDEGLRINARDYIFFLDFALKIRASRGSEIDFSKIRAFLFYLMDFCKFKIKWISYDSYQSTDSLQTFKKEKIQSKEFSVDRKPGPYRTLRSILMEKRFDAYFYEPLYEELSKLEDHSLDETGHKPEIDHPTGGSKDVSDALCGSLQGALISKGEQITGTEAEAMKERAAAYESAALMKSRKVNKIKDSSIIKTEYKSENPLEALFK